MKYIRQHHPSDTRAKLNRRRNGNNFIRFSGVLISDAEAAVYRVEQNKVRSRSSGLLFAALARGFQLFFPATLRLRGNGPTGFRRTSFACRTKFRRRTAVFIAMLSAVDRSRMRSLAPGFERWKNSLIKFLLRTSYEDSK